MDNDTADLIIRVANSNDCNYAQQIIDEMELSARIRGTGIAKRPPEYIQEKMQQGNAIIALTATGQWVGFSYIEVYSDGAFVSNSGLIVDPHWRNQGVAAAIKEKVFQLSQQKYPTAKIFSITTGAAIMKLNTRLGFEPVVYDAITHDEKFWEGCKHCVNHDILLSKQCKNCLCTAMLFVGS